MNVKTFERLNLFKAPHTVSFWALCESGKGLVCFLSLVWMQSKTEEVNMTDFYMACIKLC